MKPIHFFILLALLSSIPSVSALTAGTSNSNYLFPFPIKVNGTTVQTKLVLDANWRWFHRKTDAAQNCFPGGWNSTLCPNPTACSNNCAIEGIPSTQYASNYGVTGSNGSVSLKYVTTHEYGQNIGSRLYVTNSNGQSYYGFNMLDKEISFDADMSTADCGLNGAVYFVEMPLNGGTSNLESGYPSQFGLGYCDAQCPSPKIVNGKATGIPGYFNTGACCTEFDIWESNSRATAMAGHTCNITGLYACSTDLQCGRTGTPGVCQQGSSEYNPYRNGMTTLFGRGAGFNIDTTKKFTVKTRFITNDGTENGTLTAIKRYYVQNGTEYYGGDLPTANLLKIGQAFKRKMVLVVSIWDDEYSRMLWLDGVWPAGSTVPSDKRGPCSASSGNPSVMRTTVPNSTVVYSNVQITNL